MIGEHDLKLEWATSSGAASPRLAFPDLRVSVARFLLSAQIPPHVCFLSSVAKGYASVLISTISESTPGAYGIVIKGQYVTGCPH